MSLYYSRFIIFFCVLLFVSYDAYSDSCKEVKSRHGGPYDYTDPVNYMPTGSFPLGGVVPMVEHHFTRDIEMLARGESKYVKKMMTGSENNLTITGSLESNLSYTLREIANHPKALNSASKFEYKRENDKGFRSRHKKLEATVECYLKRAIKAFPKDSNVYFVYGIHLHRFAQYEQAIVMYKHALKLNAQYPEINYNLGLAYVKTGDISNAKKHAEIAFKKGYRLPGLKKQIHKYETKKSKNVSSEKLK